jgi:hypothetical protein
VNRVDDEWIADVIAATQRSALRCRASGRELNVLDALLELQARRAADLTPDEVRLCKAWLADLVDDASDEADPCAVIILRKILAAHGAKP